MVAPVNTTTNSLSSLLRTQQTGTVSQTANRKNALATAHTAANRTSGVPDKLKNITLTSGNPPPSNLPRGSIVDRLV